MTTTWDYSSDYRPRSPVVTINITLPWAESGPPLSRTMQIDTGADMTGIPIKVLSNLGARPVGVESAWDFNQKIVNVPVYEVNIQIADRTLKAIKVLGVGSAVGFIGRDIINNFKVTLDGNVGKTYLIS
jgi:predicted aspartyl protease